MRRSRWVYDFGLYEPFDGLLLHLIDGARQRI